MEIYSEGPEQVRVVVNESELLALKGALLEADEAIPDDMAFSARVGVSRSEARELFSRVVEAMRLLA
jgi:hypothetical protein